jgi:hypothetical protein
LYDTGADTRIIPDIHASGYQTPPTQQGDNLISSEFSTIGCTVQEMTSLMFMFQVNMALDVDEYKGLN